MYKRQVLSDPNKRAQYDRFGTIPGASGGGGSQYVDLEDLFGGGFGGMGAVSYTHLDVYKRQCLYRLRISLPKRWFA